MTENDAQTYHSTRILVVDDDHLGFLMSAILRRHGYAQTMVEKRGWDGLRAMGITETPAARSKDDPPFDLVLLDIILPDINGFDVCQRLRDVWGDRISIILVTGFDIEQQHARFVESGADDFLMKPVNSNELVNRISMQISKLKQRRGSSDITITGDLTMKRIGSYSILKTLSWSGSVVVYLAEAKGEKVVIKILTKQAMEYDDVRTRFLREAKLLSKLDHPNIITFKATGMHHGLPYFVTEYIEGENLENYVLNQTQPTFERLMTIALAIARALEHIHSQGVVHRDVKLKNTFIGIDGCVKIGDFGIALTKHDTRLTQPGYAIGTPIYMAPEQFKGHEASFKVDVYAFGASMYHLTTGLPPFSAGCAMELLRKHSTDSPRPITEVCGDLPAEWNELIVEKCMAKEPDDRPGSMTEVVQAIEAIISQHGGH